jgi:ABC-type glycerol-3-phosphate transport system substrate-binding protein
MTLITNRRRFIAGSAALAAAAALPMRPAQAASGPLSVWKFGGTSREVEMWPVRNQVFLDRNPAVQLDYTYYFGMIRRQRIVAGFQTRRLADVIIAFGQDIPEFAGFGIIRPLDDIAGDRVKGWRDRIVPEVMSTGMHEGQLYGLPTYVDMATFLAVDMDALNAAGFDRPPATWSELRAYARALTRPDRPGIAFPATTAPVDINIFQGIAYANGARVFDEPANRVTLAEQGMVDALQLYADLIADGSTPPGTVMTETNFRDTAKLFAQGRVAMWAGLSWLNTPWDTPEGLNWTGALFPRPDAVTGAYSPVATLMDPTAILMVSALGRNPEAAVAYLDFWSEEEQLGLWGGKPEFARIPAGRNAWASPVLAEIWPSWVEAYQAGTLFQGAEPMPRFIGVSVVETALGNAIQEVVLGRKTAAEALQAANESAQQQIDILRG